MTLLLRGERLAWANGTHRLHADAWRVSPGVEPVLQSQCAILPRRRRCGGIASELVAAVHTLDAPCVDEDTVKSFREYVRNSGLGTTDIDVVLKPAAGAPANAPTVFVQAKTSNAAMTTGAELLWAKKVVKHAISQGITPCQLRFVSGSPSGLTVNDALLERIFQEASNAGITVTRELRNVPNLP